MVRVGLEAMESLYHCTPSNRRTGSMRCSTPVKVRAVSAMALTGTRPHTAAMAASRFSMLCRPRSFTSSFETTGVTVPFSAMQSMPSARRNAPLSVSCRRVNQH